MAGSAVTVVGIAGGSGSGKTWLARRLGARLGERAVLLAADHYYRDLRQLSPAQLAAHNFDCPAALDHAALAADLVALRAGRGVLSPRYDFASHRQAEDRTPLEPRPVILADGLFLLAIPALRAQLDLKLFVDAPEARRRQQRIDRDCAERGIGREQAQAQYAATVAPGFARWIEPSRRWADWVVEPEALADAATAVVDWLGRRAAAG